MGKNPKISRDFQNKWQDLDFSTILLRTARKNEKISKSLLLKDGNVIFPYFFGGFLYIYQISNWSSSDQDLEIFGFSEKFPVRIQNKFLFQKNPVFL
jgi:hypothetical protein